MHRAADATTFELLERALLHPDVRRSRDALEELLAVDFVEFGRSGRVYDREQIIAALTSDDVREHGSVQISRFAMQAMSDDVVLVTYQTASQAGDNAQQRANRSSIWKWIEGRWQMVFHQGTPVPDS